MAAATTMAEPSMASGTPIFCDIIEAPPMAHALRLAFEVGTVAIIMVCTYYFIERDQLHRADVAVADVKAVSPQPDRKKMNKSIRRTLNDGCINLRADLPVWEAYLDKKAKRKLKELASKCDKLGNAENQIRP